MAEQLAFPLPHLEARGRAAFFVSQANALAVRQIDEWRAWPRGKFVLTGPEGSGKSHLAEVWAGLAGSRIVTAKALTPAEVPNLAAAPLVVEDADRIAGRVQSEAVLLHLHNLSQANGQAMLLTARDPPARWGLALPDLASRLEATATAALEPPDDALLSALLVKLFADRQISPPPRLLDYCVRRMDRSFAAARDLVDALDRRAMASGRPIGVPLAAEILEAG